MELLIFLGILAAVVFILLLIIAPIKLYRIAAEATRIRELLEEAAASRQ